MTALAAGGPEPVTEIVPGIQRITQRLGARDLHLYLVMGERPLLVDTGLASTPEQTILPALRRLGVPPTRLGFLLVTHPDVDHFGGNSAMKRAAPRRGCWPTPPTDAGSSPGRPSSPSATAGTPPTAWTTTPTLGPGSAAIWAPTPRWTPPWRAATGSTWGATGCRCCTSRATPPAIWASGTPTPALLSSETPSSSGACTMPAEPAQSSALLRGGALPGLHHPPGAARAGAPPHRPLPAHVRSGRGPLPGPRAAPSSTTSPAPSPRRCGRSRRRSPCGRSPRPPTGRWGRSPPSPMSSPAPSGPSRRAGRLRPGRHLRREGSPRVDLARAAPLTRRRPPTTAESVFETAREALPFPARA